MLNVKLIGVFMLTAVCLVSKAQFNADKDPFLVKAFKDASIQKINAQTSHGNIAISSVPAAEARIEVFTRPGNWDERNISKEDIQKRLDDNYTLEINVSGDQVTAVAKRRNNLNIGNKTLSISFVIYAPEKVTTVLRTSHGNITMSGLTGNQDFSTSHGNLSLTSIKGKLTGVTSHGNISISEATDDIDLQTSHGNIDAKNCGGALKLVTSQGNVQINGIKGKVRTRTDHGNIEGDIIEGELSASTSHGDVELKNLSCSVETSTSHGNISLTLNQVTGPLNVSNATGDIALQLPDGKGVDLDIQGKDIKLLTVKNFSGSQDNHSIKGTLNGGGPAVKLRTGRGKISLLFK